MATPNSFVFNNLPDINSNNYYYDDEKLRWALFANQSCLDLFKIGARVLRKIDGDGSQLVPSSEAI